MPKTLKTRKTPIEFLEEQMLGRNIRRRSLSKKEASFIEQYTKTLHHPAAAALAGQGYGSTKKMLNKESVRRTLEIPAKKVMKKLEYNLERAMKETARVMKFAMETKNANAYYKAVELRTRLFKLVDNNNPANAAMFVVRIEGLTALNNFPANMVQAHVVNPNPLPASPEEIKEPIFGKSDEPEPTEADVLEGLEDE